MLFIGAPIGIMTYPSDANSNASSNLLKIVQENRKKFTGQESF